jgi:hypothetical protein
MPLSKREWIGHFHRMTTKDILEAVVSLPLMLLILGISRANCSRMKNRVKSSKEVKEPEVI